MVEETFQGRNIVASHLSLCCKFESAKYRIRTMESYHAPKSFQVCQ